MINEALLLEKKLTTDFTFGFELEALADGRLNFDYSNSTKEFIESYFGNAGDFHSDSSIEVNPGCVLYYEDEDGDEYYYYEDENMTKDELFMNFETDNIDDIDFQTPFEYASPVLEFNIENIQKVINMLNEGLSKGYFKTNDSCGFHHHLSYQGITGEDAAWIVSQLALDDSARELFSKFNTISSEGNEVNYDFITTWSNKEYLYDLADAIRVFDFKEIVRLLNTDKYSILNVHSNKTLEWRGPRDFLESEDKKIIIDFYKQLWKVVNWMTTALDKKEINGMDKNIYLKNLIIGNNIKPIYNFPEFTIDKDKKELSEEEINNIISKIDNNPTILISLSSKKRILDQVIQKLFNTSRLGKTIDALKNQVSIYPQVINDIAYKYIPAKIFTEASSDAIYNTSLRTLNRLVKTKFGLDKAEIVKRITILIPDMNPQLFKDNPEYIDNILKVTEYALIEYFLNMFDEQYDYIMVSNYIKEIINSGYSSKYLEGAINKLSDENKKNLSNLLSKYLYRFPEFIKYIDNIDNKMVLSIIGYSMRNGNYDKIKQILLNSGKVNEKLFNELESKFSAYYKHDLNDDFELEQ